MVKANSENSFPTVYNRQSGNAMVYILIGLALIGLLTATLANQNKQSDSQNIDEEKISLYTLQLVEYAASAKGVIEQMEISGSDFSQLSFINPTSSVPFNAAPHIHKVYHPTGGGLTYKATTDFPDGIFLGTTGWNFSNTTNVEWSKTTANDLIFTAMDITADICAAINKDITGSETIPVATVTAASMFATDTASNDLDTTNCANCEGYPSLCLVDSGGDYAFYNLMINR